MKLNAYQQQVKVFPDGGKTLAAASIGLSSEAGKLQAALADHITKDEKVSKEDATRMIGSVLWQLSFIATSLDITLEECAIANVVEKRKEMAEAVTQ